MKKSSLYAILAALSLAVVAFLFFYPDDIQGNVLQQQDIQQGLANGQEGKVFHEATGETTRWTNSLFGGMPNFQIAPSYAASSMLDWVAKVYTLGLPSPANLLFALMLGFFIMMLCMKQKWHTALFGALAWGFSTYFIILIGAGHIWKFVTLAYIPPTIGGIVLCYRGKYLGGTAMAALFGALQLQSNHPQMSYYFLFVIAAMVIAWLVEAIRSHTVKQWGIATACVVAAGALGVAANATSLYNSYEYSRQTIRGRATELTEPGKATAQGLDKEYITGWSYGVDETLTLMIPNVKGGATIKPVAGNNELMSLADTPVGENCNEQEFYLLQQLPQYFGDQPMTNGPVYVGAFVLLLAILALFVVEKSPMKWALFAIGILAILLSWGHNFMWLTDLFIDWFPGYNKFRTVSSILVIVEFTIPVAAVMCLHKIITTPDFLERYRRPFYIVFGAGAFVCLVGALFPSMFGTPFSANEIDQLRQMGLFNNPEYSGLVQAVTNARYSLVSSDCWRSLLFIALGFGVLMLYLSQKQKKPQYAVIMVCGLSLLMLIDLYTVNKRYVNTENFVAATENDAPFTPTPADRQILKDTAMNYRVYDVEGFSSARSSYFHKTIGGYHAAKLTRYNDLIEKQITKGNIGVINMLNAKYVISNGEAIPNPDALGNAWFVDSLIYVDGANAEMAALDSLDTGHAAVVDKPFQGILKSTAAKQPGDTIFETTYAPNRLTYHSQSAANRVAVFSEVYFPWGWTATIDGKPAEIARVNYVLRALSVPAGNHTIEFRFEPQSQVTGERISIASIIIVYMLIAGSIVLAVVGHLRHKKGGKPEDNAPKVDNLV